MKPELIEILRMRWQRLRIYRRPGSVLVDYRILRNFVRIYQFTGLLNEHSIPPVCT
ncbi:DNA breaking-rejoining protein [Salmonella enterica subsp. enterica]|uniref:DNA breaking-rejoining protein n=1 Tax=Salmonella enterica I TaxID=59201 RepID=A0A447PF05_SALET|nr:DNA breaking-rejoining protein [Salmonella enterica subsp. enterica]